MLKYDSLSNADVRDPAVDEHLDPPEPSVPETPTPPPPDCDPDCRPRPDATADAATSELRAFREAGRASLERMPTGATGRRKGNDRREWEAEERASGMKEERLKKARYVAEVYSEAEFDRLCDLVRRSPEAGFSVSHLAFLSRVPRREDRDRLAESAVRERWSARVLESEVKGLRPTREKGGGRKPKVMPHEKGARHQLRAASVSFANSIKARCLSGEIGVLAQAALQAAERLEAALASSPC